MHDIYKCCALLSQGNITIENVSHCCPNQAWQQ
jgi:hypothetical protein